MSYTPTDWKTGDVITADKLNNMESGIVQAFEVIVLGPDLESEYLRLNRTFGEIKSAVEAGKTPIFRLVVSAEDTVGYQWCIPDGVVVNENGGGTVIISSEEFEAATDSDYPSGGK